MERGTVIDSPIDPTIEPTMDPSIDGKWTPDLVETELVRLERFIAQARAVQARLVDEARRLDMPMMDGTRTITEWVASRLDVERRTAGDLVKLSDSLDLDDLENGEVSADRAVARRKLADTGACKDLLATSDRYDLSGVRRIIAGRRRMTRRDERVAFDERRLLFRESDDRTTTRLWGELPSAQAKIVEEALRRVGDDLPDSPDGRSSLAQRNADALVELCLGEETDSGAAGPAATVVVDARVAAPTDGEAGVSVLGGGRVGPGALDAVQCEGTIEVVAVAEDGTPLGIGHASPRVPPKLRRHVLGRDGSCTADGCSSTHRLQVHHVRPASRGGPTEASNLKTLCWFHHQIVVHGRGFRIDPDSPDHRVRFLAPADDRGPPG